MVERLLSTRLKKAKAPPPVRLVADSCECPGSSNLVKARYNKDTGEMQVDFKNATTYAYDLVSTEHWQGFVAADSKGKYLAAEIKPNYATRKVVL